MPKPKVFITRIIPEEGLDLLIPHCEIDLWPENLPPDRQTLLDRVQGVAGLLCLLTDPVDGEVMDRAGKSLKVISNHAVGFDNIDVPAATQRGIPVGNTPGILTETTADFAFALLLAAARRVVEGQRAVIAGEWKTWSPQWLLGPDVYGATLGIVGFGRIGQAVARRAAGFNMRVCFYDPHPAQGWESQGISAVQTDFSTLLREADFVSLHAPLTEQTRGMFDARAFSQMKPAAIFINTSRGPLVDQQALLHALQGGQIAAAAIDVTVPEPLPVDSELLKLPNLIVTPHIASASRPTRSRMARMAAENLLAGLQGAHLPYCVNPEVYARPSS